jgi:hypothetical protein
MPNLIVSVLRLRPVGPEQENWVKVRPARAAAEDFKKSRRVIIQCCLWKFSSIVQPFLMKDFVAQSECLKPGALGVPALLAGL